jgi:hypothetical protein
MDDVRLWLARSLPQRIRARRTRSNTGGVPTTLIDWRLEARSALVRPSPPKNALTATGPLAGRVLSARRIDGH